MYSGSTREHFFFLSFKIRSMPSTSRRFRGKVKNREWALKQRNNPQRSLQERKKEVDDGESTGRERGREFASKPRHWGGSKVCALHHNGHPVTNTDEPGRVMLHSQAWYLMGKQVVIAWNSMDFFAPYAIPLHSYQQWRHLWILKIQSQDCSTRKMKDGEKKKKLTFYQCFWQILHTCALVDLQFWLAA